LPCRRDVTGEVLEVTIRAAFKNSLAAEALDLSLSLPISALPRLERHSAGPAPTETITAVEGPKLRRALTVISD